MLIQNFGSHSIKPQMNSRPAGCEPSGESSPPAPTADTAEISSQPTRLSRGWLSGLKKTGLALALGACLAGPLAATASAQSYCQPFPQRPLVVQTMPRHYHHNQQPRIGISIGPGGIHVEAGIGHRHHRGWGQPPVIVHQPPVVIQQPQVVIQQPPVVIQQPPVVIQQQPPVVVVQPTPVVIQHPGGWWGY